MGGDELGGPTAVSAPESGAPVSPSVAAQAANEVTPLLVAETLAVILLCWGYGILMRWVWPNPMVISPGTLLVDVLTRKVAWATLVVCLLMQRPPFEWRLPTSLLACLKEAAWGVLLFLASLCAASICRRVALAYGADSQATRWDEALRDPAVLLTFRLVAPLAAFGEEMVYRVYLQTRLTPILGGHAVLSVPLCAFLFATGHGYAAAQTAGVFGSGLVLGMAYQSSRQVPRLVVAHTLNLLV